ncbi:hypothetical protein LINGRAPRIM_LOCUS949 [Linum grandiflorum]
MAATSAQSSVVQALSRNLPRNAPPSRASPVSLSSRRHMLFLLTAVPALSISVKEPISRAQDIPLFGLKRKLKKAEEEAELLVKEGFETAEKGLETAEKGLESAERGIENVLSFGGLAQAGVVAGVEVVAVLLATSVVNGILGPEARNS